MEIRTIWQQGQYPSFNLELASEEGRDAFLVLKGCKIMSGTNGPFVSVPSKKNEQTGKYWNHAYLGDKFAAVVLSKAQESQPREAPQRMAPKSQDGFKARQLAPSRDRYGDAPSKSEGMANDGMDSDIPF
jgi:DNA-binding cell septation regulator SpoVG